MATLFLIIGLLIFGFCGLYTLIWLTATIVGIRRGNAIYNKKLDEAIHREKIRACNLGFKQNE